jgi:hypothetical protein
LATWQSPFAGSSVGTATSRCPCSHSPASLSSARVPSGGEEPMDLTAELLPLTVPEVRRLLAPLFHRSSGQDATHVLHQRILAVLTNLSNDTTVPPRKDHRRSWRGSSQYFASAVCQRPYGLFGANENGGHCRVDPCSSGVSFHSRVRPNARSSVLNDPPSAGRWTISGALRRERPASVGAIRPNAD